MPKLYILVGVPGSGKTTWVSTQVWAKNCLHISADHFIQEYNNRTHSRYSDVFRDYMPAAINRNSNDLLKAKQNQQDIIWDQTSTTIYSRKRKLDLLPEYYSIAVVFPTPPREELDKRLLDKSISKDTLNTMIQDFEMPKESEGFKEIWIVN